EQGRAPGDGSSDSAIRRAGRQLIFSLYGALRAVKLYPVENAAVQKALADVTQQTKEMLATEGELELRMSGEFIFINQTRLRLDLDNFASFSHLLALLRASGIGSVTIAAAITAKDWLVFLSLLQAPGSDDAAERLEQLMRKLEGADVRAFTFSAPTDPGGDNREKNKERAKRTYAQSVAATRELMSSVRMGGSPNVKKI